MKESRADLPTVLARIVGAAYRGSSRVGGMEIFEFGTDVAWTNRYGEAEQRPRFELHVQSPWRIVVGNRVAVASGDIEIAPSGSAIDEYAARSDRLLSAFPVATPRSVVQTLSPGHGDAVLTFSDGSVLEIFVDTSMEDREAYWIGDFAEGSVYVRGRGVIDA